MQECVSEDHLVREKKAKYATKTVGFGGRDLIIWAYGTRILNNEKCNGTRTLNNEKILLYLRPTH